MGFEGIFRGYRWDFNGFERIFTGFDGDFLWDFHGLSLMRFQRILVEFEWDQDDIAKFTGDMTRIS